MIIDLWPTITELYAPKTRKTGRYNVSEMWAITKQFLSPKDYFSPKPITIEQWHGIQKHRSIQEALEHMGWEIEPKRELAFEGVTLVGKADALKEEGGLEIKTTERRQGGVRVFLHKARPWHLYQSKVLCTLFERPKWQVVEPGVGNPKLYLKVIGEVERDDEWFKKETEKLLAFHQKVIGLSHE